MDRGRAEQLLQTAVADPGAHFRRGQWEAIDALVNQRRKLMVVQRTGWGKAQSISSAPEYFVIVERAPL